MSDLRPVQAIDVRGLTPQQPPTGLPIFEWVDPRSLFVDPAYQRDLGERSLRQIRRIVEQFDWTRFKPPICAFSEMEGVGSILKVIDGQHTAIGAASNPHVTAIPVMIVEAADVQAQAQAFLGQNLDRLGMTATQMHVAAVTAGDEQALAIAAACKEAGLRILKHPPSRGVYLPGDTVALAAIGGLLNRMQREHAVLVLATLAAAEFAPVKADQIKALEFLLTDPQFELLDIDTLPHHLKSLDDGAGKEAKTFAVTHTLPLWKATAMVWFQKAKKLKAGGIAIMATPSPASPRAANAGPPVQSGARLAPAPVPADLYLDPRPARGAWAPGNQVVRCRECDRRFRGGPAAKMCAECAYPEGEGA